MLGRVPPLLRERVFRRYWSAQSISMLGDQVNGIALPLVGVLTLHATPAQMGVLTALVWAPNLVLALHAGALADRWGRRRRVMIASDLGRALLLASVPIAAALGVLSMAQLYVVAFAAGSLSVFFQVADSTLFVCVVDRDRYLDANSLVYGSRAVSFMAGPSLGGMLTQAASAPVALLVDAASFVGRPASSHGSRRPSRRRSRRSRATSPPASATSAVRRRSSTSSPRRPRSTSSISGSSRSSCSTPRARSTCVPARWASCSDSEPSAACWERS